MSSQKEPFVYVIAFSGDDFVMVRHRRRAWEMPGGRVDPGETVHQAAAREFTEETGMLLEPVGHMTMGEGTVVVGVVDARCCRIHPSDEVAEVRLFSELPDGLSFPEVEYRTMLDRAREMVESFKRGNMISASASPQAKPLRSE
jgi:8-oxo-dGTP diphosphatase